jgi:hypothetical protein
VGAFLLHLRRDLISPRVLGLFLAFCLAAAFVNLRLLEAAVRVW